LDPAFSPEQQHACEVAYRQLLIQGILAVLLPTEDLGNACLRTLVTDVISDLILGQAIGQKISEPWFVHGTISKVVDIVTSRMAQPRDGTGVPDTDGPKDRLEKFGLLSSKLVEKENNSSTRRQSSLSAWLWRLLQYAFVAYQIMRFLLLGLAHAHRLPRRAHAGQFERFPPSSFARQRRTDPARPPLVHKLSSPRAFINYRLFACMSTILDLTSNMPWFTSSLAYCEHALSTGPGKYGAANSTLDK
jgi:hypothetical protein